MWNYHRKEFRRLYPHDPWVLSPDFSNAVPFAVDVVPNLVDPFAFTHMDLFKTAMPLAHNHMQDVLDAPQNAGKAPPPLDMRQGADVVVIPIDVFTPQHFKWIVPDDVNPLSKWVIESESAEQQVEADDEDEGEDEGEDEDEDEEPTPVTPPAEKPKPQPKPKPKVKSSVAADEVCRNGCAHVYSPTHAHAAARVAGCRS